MNELKNKFELDSREIRLLTEEFGKDNVETTMVFISNARDPKGLRVMISPTYEMVRDCLEAVHGRLGVGWNRMKGDSAFYHHPDGAGELPVEKKVD